jgi:hypothetical protein
VRGRKILSCARLWRPWSIGPEPSTLEGRREAAVHEYLYGMDRRPRKYEMGELAQEETMSAKKATQKSEGFTDEERAAMKERA